MVIANILNTYTTVAGLWQYDYGQILRLQGIKLPTAVEIHFSLQEKGGESVTRIGTTKDGVTDVVIPDSMLENDATTMDYKIYAFIYLADSESGQTEYKISMSVKSRPKPEGFEKPEDAELFRQAITEVNNSAEVALQSKKEAEAWAHGHVEYADRDEDNAKYYAKQAKDEAEKIQGKVKEGKEEIDRYIKENRNDLKGEIGKVETSRAAVELCKQEVESAQADVEQMRQDTQQAAQNASDANAEAQQAVQQAEASRSAAQTSEQNAAASRDFANTYKEAAETAKSAAETAAQNASESKTAAETAAQNAAQSKADIDSIKAGIEEAAKGENVSQIQKNMSDIGQLKESLKDINVETDKTLTEEDKPADAKMTGKKISELSKNIEDEKNKNVVTLISKEDFKVIEDSEEITDENKLYSFNSAFSANFISSTNNKYLLSVDDSGQFTANFVKENTEKILLSAFKIESFPEVSNIIYVSLGRQPENDVTLQITSDSNVILSATELTFTKENFFIPQPVSISSNTKTTSIVKIIGKETATIDLIVSGNIRYLFRNGQYASDITVTTDVGYGGTYSISDNLITLGGTIGLILSGVNLKNGDTIIVNCTNANDSSAHYTALQNGGTMLVTRKASDLYADIQLNGNAQIQYTNTTGSTIPDITIKNSFTKFKGDSIRVIEV